MGMGGRLLLRRRVAVVAGVEMWLWLGPGYGQCQLLAPASVQANAGPGRYLSPHALAHIGEWALYLV